VELGGRARDDVGPEVHVAEAGHTGTQHLGDGELRAIAHEPGIDPALLQRPDDLAEPGHQRAVLCAAAQQGHRRMRVGVDEAGQQGVLRPLDRARGVETLTGRGRRHDRDDTAVPDRNRVRFQNAVGRLHWNDPACTDKRVDRFHADTSGGGGSV
jgi:hypothetical protein